MIPALVSFSIFLTLSYTCKFCDILGELRTDLFKITNHADILVLLYWFHSDRKKKHNQLKTQLRIWTVFFFTTNPGYLFKQVFICYHIQLPLYRNRKRKSMWLIKDLWGDCSFSNIKSFYIKQVLICLVLR